MKLSVILLLINFFAINAHKKKAIIFGVTGQDGAYLTEFLLEKGYEVHGVKRRSSSLNTSRVDKFYKDPHVATDFFLHYGDLTDSSTISRIITEVLPDEIYNLAAQSHVRVSFDIPEYTGDVVALGALRILEVIRNLRYVKNIKYYQASSSEMFGMVHEIPQRESTPFYPRSPYGVSKVFAYWITVNYRESYNIFACNGILFNHESPLRGETFVTRKITRAVSRIARGSDEVLFLGNLDAKRDWGYAKEYVEVMWLMLQQESPDDYVVATGETHTVREFVEVAFKCIGIELEWHGEELDEIGIDKKTKKIYVRVDQRYFRPAEVDILVGDATKTANKLHWRPKTTFNELVALMIRGEFNED